MKTAYLTIPAIASLIFANAKAQDKDEGGTKVALEEVEVAVRRPRTTKMQSSILNTDLLGTAELSRAACCNLGESFTTNPSVDVSYSDATTGAKQIRLLGLSGTYVQMLTENVPDYRGASSPYTLGYIPGPWMQSIQVSKGCASVKHGYESVTGQINVEYKKPQAPEALSANLYANSKGKFEANADANIRLTDRLATGLLLHYENLSKNHDDNRDGFADMPGIRQYNLQNKWAWSSNRYIFQASLKALAENRHGGQTTHTHTQTATQTAATGTKPYRIDINTHRIGAFTKNAFILNAESGSNIALILSGSSHLQDAGYGNKAYDVNQKNAYASLMFESDLNPQHNISLGLSLNHDHYKQHCRTANDANAPLTHSTESETVPGAYVQYTYNLNGRLIAMAGLRADHSSLYGTFLTPRAHIKYVPNETVNFRASAGKGYRTPHALAENHYLLASARNITVSPNLQQEEALNLGMSASLNLTVLDRTLNVNAEYYYTNFIQQTVADMDSNPHAVIFGNLDGRSYSHTVQIEASYPFFKGFFLTGAYRLNDAKTTYGGQLRERPLTGKSKALLTASYKTPLELWQFDLTLQLNGSGRMPDPYTLPDGSPSWNRRFDGYEQVSAQVTRYFRHLSVYAGGENLTGKRQRNPVIGADNPWGERFDGTMVWGPVHGAIFYAGIRFNFNKD